jgi:pimeloyl-ACP methyl ester carboxylesterase
MFLLAVLLCGPVQAETRTDTPLNGYWSGWAERDGIRSDVAVRLFDDKGTPGGTVDWPAMGYLRTDLISVQFDGTDAVLSVPLPVGALKLRGSLLADTIRGTLEPIGLVRGEWQSLGRGGAFELRREREPPLPYRVEDLTFQSGEQTIAGSLFMPLQESLHAGIVFVAGSGDTTRGDGTFLADHLARAGVAALVYDKRGAGKSTGDWRKGGFEELAGDATEALKLLQGHAGIDRSRTGFVCQSQGCWVVPVALRKGAPARFAVFQSGPAVSVADEDLDYYRVTLTARGFGPDEIDEAFALVKVNQQLSLGKASWKDLQDAITRYSDRAWFKALGYSPSPAEEPECVFERETLGYDPSADIDAIRIPSLWIYGDADTIIPVQTSIDKLRLARPTPSLEVAVLHGVGHSFTTVETVIPRLAAEYPGLVSAWISRQH